MAELLVTADETNWEARFIAEFIDRTKRDRIHSLLKKRKTRKKFIDRLNHALDYDRSRAKQLDPALKNADALIEFLLQKEVDPEICCLIADSSKNDGKTLTLAFTVGELLNNHWGAVIVCPPQPIELYERRRRR